MKHGIGRLLREGGENREKRNPIVDHQQVLALVLPFRGFGPISHAPMGKAVSMILAIVEALVASFIPLGYVIWALWYVNTHFK